ncbi:fimbrial protein [Salmonella enterica subsp. enterica serovar Havana]|nr:fimbrial protein [Salmonella enterica]EBX0471232.1 fimbrial protein [Salmonella enterica subsp. enterica serovar Havana]EBX8401079.1 fimbrial protein [Salmonella enterica subsp. enterica serovar Oranienburg]EAW1072354.1 fimbrial protein [Salmonella enterica]EAY1112499.1 fimbrial protein [Salmonella enterica]
MNQYKKNAVVAGMLMTVLAVAYPAGAADQERQMPLGVVNGQVKDNQRVEVTRTLPSPELYRETDAGKLPAELRVRNASARAGDNGTVWLTVSRPLPEGKTASVSVRVALWVDGQRVATGYREEGLDVVLPVPAAQKEVVLRSDTPVTLAVPAGWRGVVQPEMEIEGWQQ